MSKALPTMHVLSTQDPKGTCDEKVNENAIAKGREGTVLGLLFR
jgi:hypothetical protein